MIDLTDNAGSLLQMFFAGALYYWSGLINGEALTALFRKQFQNFLDHYKYPYLIFFVMLLPVQLLPNIAADYLMREPVGIRILIGTLFFVPVWVGLLAGISSSLIPGNALKQFVRFAPAVIAAVAAIVMMPVIPDWLSAYNSSSKVISAAFGALTVTSIIVLLNAGQMLYRATRLAEELITEIPADTGPQNLRDIFRLLQQDAEILNTVPKHKHISPWKSIYFPGRKTDAFAVYGEDALYLRISAGLNFEQPAFSFKIFPRKVIWAKIDWEKVSRFSEDKIVGYHETHVVLSNSGLVIALPGNSPILTNLPVSKAADAFVISGVPAQ